MGTKTAGAIILGYTLRVRSDAEKVVPEFTAPSNYGAEKAIEFVNNKRMEWRDGGAARMPYSGTLDTAAIIALPTRVEMASGLREVEVHKDMNDVTELARYLRQRYASAFDDNGENIAGPIRVVAFEPRTAMKILSLEAAERGVPLPHELWYSADYRDVVSAVAPDQSTLPQALTRLVPDEVGPSYTYGEDAVQDAWLAARLVLKLDLLPAWNDQILRAVHILAGSSSTGTNRKPQTTPMLTPHAATSKPNPVSLKPRKKLNKPLA